MHMKPESKTQRSPSTIMVLGRAPMASADVMEHSKPKFGCEQCWFCSLSYLLKVSTASVGKKKLASCIVKAVALLKTRSTASANYLRLQPYKKAAIRISG